MWPATNDAVAALVHDQLRAALAGIRVPGVRSIVLVHFGLGPPPIITGIKSWSSPTANAVVIDVDFRIAGSDPIAVLELTLAGGVVCVVQLAALQLSAVARVTLGPFVPVLPPISAATVSLLGDPFLDFSLTALRGDIMALPWLPARSALCCG